MHWLARMFNLEYTDGRGGTMCNNKILVDLSEYNALIQMYHSVKAAGIFFRESTFVVQYRDRGTDHEVIEGAFSFPIPDEIDVLCDAIIDMYQSVDRAAEFVLQ